MADQPYVIVGIHGLANKPPQPEKGAWWKAAVQEGLVRNCGRTAPDNFVFDFVYWADLRYPAPVADPANNEPYFTMPGSGPLPRYAANKWDLFATAAETQLSQKLDRFEAHVGIDPVAMPALEWELDDLAEYYRNGWYYHRGDGAPDSRKQAGGFRDAVRQLLRDTLVKYEGRRIMIVAHSMGTIIAYDVLRLLGRERSQTNIGHFITIGSPLGMAYVKRQIYLENDQVRTPTVVGKWTNFAERRDIVALDAKLADDFEPNAAGVKVLDVPVLNVYRGPNSGAMPNYHKSYGYLRTPELSEAVRNFL